MRVVFDTSALIALLEPKDQYHPIARDILKELLKGGSTFLIPHVVFIEFCDNMVSVYGKRCALEKITTLKRSKVISYLHETDQEMENGLLLFRKFNDVDTSLTDSVVFSLMKSRNIIRVFTFDSHFKMMGFEVIPWSSS